MTSRWAGLDDVYLKPGELYLPHRPPFPRVITVLGSCVAVVLHSPASRHSTMCHGVLPKTTGRADVPEGYFVDAAIARMLAWHARRNATPALLVAKVFGGASLNLRGAAEKAGLSVGARNVAAARQALADAGTSIQAGDVGGQHGRRLCLFPQVGEVWVYRVRREHVSNAGTPPAAPRPGR